MSSFTASAAGSWRANPRPAPNSPAMISGVHQRQPRLCALIAAQRQQPSRQRVPISRAMNLKYSEKLKRKEPPKSSTIKGHLSYPKLDLTPFVVVRHTYRSRRDILVRMLPDLVIALTVGALTFTSSSIAAYVNFEGKQTSPVRLSPDGTRLFAVNTPDARLSVFDVTLPSNPKLIAEIPVGVEPVSVNVRNNDEAWVVNEVLESVSIVSVSNRIVVDTL